MRAPVGWARKKRVLYTGCSCSSCSARTGNSIYCDRKLPERTGSCRRASAGGHGRPYPPTAHRRASASVGSVLGVFGWVLGGRTEGDGGAGGVVGAN